MKSKTFSLPDFAIGDVVTSFPALYHIAASESLRVWFQNPRIRALWAGPPIQMLRDPDADAVELDIREAATLFGFSGLHMAQAWFWSFGVRVPETIPCIDLNCESVEGLDVVISPFSTSGTRGAPIKIWPYEYWNKVINSLIAAGLSVGVCGVFGAGADPRSCDNKFWDNPSVNVLDSLELTQLVGILRSSRCVATVDNGVGHLAHLAGAPHVQLIPMHPDFPPAAWVRNQNLNAASLFRPFIEDANSIKFEEVLAEIFSMLARPDARDGSSGRVNLARLAATINDDGIPNVAIGKLCTQSSLSDWSRGTTLAEDAGGAVDGKILGIGKFHTAVEDSPWWEVDLGDPYEIAEVRIFNRLDNAAIASRASYLAIEIGMERFDLAEAFKRELDEPFGGIDGNPLVFRPSAAILGRFVRIRLLRPGCLHLDQVQVYGEPLPESSVRSVEQSVTRSVDQSETLDVGG